MEKDLSEILSSPPFLGLVGFVFFCKKRKKKQKKRKNLLRSLLSQAFLSIRKKRRYPSTEK
jgi:preprotein translocase subunit YajC